MHFQVRMIKIITITDRKCTNCYHVTLKWMVVIWLDWKFSQLSPMVAHFPIIWVLESLFWCRDLPHSSFFLFFRTFPNNKELPVWSHFYTWYHFPAVMLLEATAGCEPAESTATGSERMSGLQFTLFDQTFQVSLMHVQDLSLHKLPLVDLFLKLLHSFHSQMWKISESMLSVFVHLYNIYFALPSQIWVHS